MRSQNRHPILAGIGIALLLVLLAVLCWAAAADDLLPGFLRYGAVPVTVGLSDQIPAGSLAIFDRNLYPALGRAAAFRTEQEILVGWVISEQPGTVLSGSDAYTLTGALGTVRWTISYLGAALLFLRQIRWLVWGFTAGILTVLVWFAATAKRRRHRRKVKHMLETFERTAQRYENDEEDF